MISACNRFKYLDILFASAEEEKKKNTEKSAKPAKPEKLEKNEKLPGGKGSGHGVENEGGIG